MYKLPLRSILLSTLVLSGCLLADRFDSRVLKYNEQASNIRSQVLMVNILRSAYREPVMFTDLSAVTGTASASGGLDVKLPFGGSSSGYMLNPMASLSGGPTFNVVAYNTKDFYNGMLNPIPLKVFELYLEQGRPLGLLADLFFREITFTAKDGTEKTISSRWDPNKPANFSNFQNVTSDLSYAGLKIETCNYGQGPMGGQETVAGLPAAGMRMKKQKRLPNRAKKPGKVPADSWVVIMENREFCFDPPDDIDYRKLMVLNGGIVEARLCKDSRLRVAPPFDNECADAHGAGGRTEEIENNITFTTRSTLGIIYYLGQLVRPHLNDPNTILPWFYISEDDGKHLFKNERRTPVLFRLKGPLKDHSNSRNDSHLISVDFEGDTYTAAADAGEPATDYTTAVLEMVQELIALNSSAKDLPQPAALTIVGQ